MSFIKCPLCGRNVSLKKFDPTSFDDDIYIQEVKGLGKGRGFSTVGTRSIFEDGKGAEALSRIKMRLLRLVSVLLERGLVTRRELREQFGLPAVPSMRIPRPSEHTLREELQAVKVSREEILEGVREVTELAYEAAGVEFDELGAAKEPIEYLRSGFNLLLEELKSLKVKEEEGRMD